MNFFSLTQPSPPGHSFILLLMSKHHYYQMVMMMVHFFALISQCFYYTMDNIYYQDLNSSNPEFEKITDCLYMFLFFASLISCYFILFHALLCAHGVFIFGIIGGIQSCDYLLIISYLFCLIIVILAVKHK